MKHQDKILHFFASGWLFLMLNHFIQSMTLCLFIALVVGILWELGWNYFKKKPIDFYDIVADLLGIFLSIFAFIEL